MKRTFHRNTLLTGLTLCASAVLGAAMAQPLTADWLYLSESGSWVARSETLLKAQSQLRLPVESLSADQFWWQAEDPRTQLTWQQTDPSHLPKRGSSVEIEGENGFWLVQEVSQTHLVLQQGKLVRYWPQTQWHQLQWTSAADFGLSLAVLQPENKTNALFYAWQEPALSAQVRYRLSQQGKAGTLYQELIVSNLTDSDIQAAGYSFAQQAQQAPVAMRTMVAMSESAKIDTPKQGQSQGVPTLVSEQTIELAARAHVWLPVQQLALDSVERSYSLNWDSRQTGLQQAQTQLQLTSSTELPDISGSVKIGIFDQQLPLQQSYYRAEGTNSATLDVGRSTLVTMDAKLIREGQWQLLLVNRSQQDADIGILVNHRQGNTSQRLPLDLQVKANSEQRIELEQLANGSLRVKK